MSRNASRDFPPQVIEFTRIFLPSIVIRNGGHQYIITIYVFLQPNYKFTYPKFSALAEDLGA